MIDRNKEQGTGNKENGAARNAAGGFRGLVAWQKSHKLATAVYKALSNDSSHRWLAVQAMRAAISVPANIAEGYTRGSLRDYARFLDI
ncbi:MAG TPA: four helix bundle protein, partial [Candidatus Krumholzibacteria bacterium]